MTFCQTITFGGNICRPKSWNGHDIVSFQCQKVLKINHVVNIRDDIYHSSKKIQPGTKDRTSNNHFFGGKTCRPNLETYTTQPVSIPESTWLIFLDLIYGIREDSCGETTKFLAETNLITSNSFFENQPGREYVTSNSYILEVKSVEPSFDMVLTSQYEITQSAFNVRKY